MKVLFAGGGTAGHINPALAIANYIKEKEPQSEFLFVGTTQGLEKTLVPRSGYTIRFIDVMGLRRRVTLENVKVFCKAYAARKDAEKIIGEFKPDIVVATGGYVCLPAGQAAKKKKIPLIIHEQNVFPGLAIKMLAKKADVTAISFAETHKLLNAKRAVLTGNPLRPALFTPPSKEDLRNGFEFLDEPIVLLFGGSLGAENLNRALFEMLTKDRVRGFNLIAATGEKHYDGFVSELRERGVYVENMKNVRLVPYIYNMEKIFGAADLIVSRAGAITLSEINALGKPSLLIPSPYVANNHQEYNARYLEKFGAAKLLKEKDLTGDSLFEAVSELLRDPHRLEVMGKCSKKLGITDACEKIYRLSRELLS